MSKRYYSPIATSKADVKGHSYYCDHPLYNDCTLFLLPDGKGLAVIQQRFNPQLKYTWWGKIDEGINVDISAAGALDEYLYEHADFPSGDLYPTVELRKMMWALKLPPLKKCTWETKF